jgi:DNA polymerase-3 subunit gamma/tau
MGKALYREYRPTTLEGVIGQEHITDTLKNALKKGSISHAYLFTGPKGVGKTSIARILAHEINGIKYTDESIHLDIIEIDAASNRRIDEIRDLRDKVHIAPTSSKYKVYIIDEVHMLTREAFNALLKTLEEPPAHVVFILATTEAHKVPDTIISRTQRFTFKPISEEKALSHLRSIADKEKIKISDEALTLLADHGGGSFRDSISMLDQLAGLGKDKFEVDDVRMLLGVPSVELIENMVSAIESNNISAVFETVQNLREQGIDSGRAALSISSALRNKMINGETKLDHAKAVKLLKDLLPLTLGSNDFIGLELAIIDAIDVATSENVVVAKPAPPKQEVPTTEKEEKKEIESLKPETAKPVKSLEPVSENTVIASESDLDEPKKPAKPVKFNNDSWNELLDSLKKKHNTLYGVLRMAEPNQDEGLIELNFKFSFHKKQVDTPQNAAILKDFINTYFGTKNFKTVYKKTLADSKSSTATPQKMQKPSIVASVSNIFEGAELLES